MAHLRCTKGYALVGGDALMQRHLESKGPSGNANSMCWWWELPSLFGGQDWEDPLMGLIFMSLTRDIIRCNPPPPHRGWVKQTLHAKRKKERLFVYFNLISCYQNWHVLKSQRSNVTKPPKSFGDIIVLPGNGEAKLIELNMLPGELDWCGWTLNLSERLGS